MQVFSELIFLALIGLFLASTILSVHLLRKRRYAGAVLCAIPAVVFSVYFAHVLFGPFQFSSSKSNFRYALGFELPDGVTNLETWKEEGFSPGVVIYLYFVAATNTLALILPAGHFTNSTADEFQGAQKHASKPDWWQPKQALLTDFWKSEDFNGPYAFHSAYLAYEVSTSTVWIYLDAFE